MFRGRFELTIDAKGRFNVPSRFRDTLRERYDERLIITNFDNCLVAYPFSEWVEIERKASSLSMVRKEAKRFLRFFVSGAAECSLDRQGRVLIPPVLRDFAGLDRDIVLAGMLSRMEIWSRERWNEELKLSKESFEDMADVLSDLGI